LEIRDQWIAVAPIAVAPIAVAPIAVVLIDVIRQSRFSESGPGLHHQAHRRRRCHHYFALQEDCQEFQLRPSNASAVGIIGLMSCQ
jgi:hypothetical protein